MHILSVQSESKISLDIRKLNAEIQAIQESHLDENHPTEIIKGLVSQLHWLNPPNWIQGGLSLAIMCFLMLAIIPCFVKFVLQRYVHLSTELHGLRLQQHALKKKKGGPVGGMQSQPEVTPGGDSMSLTKSKVT